MFSNLLKKIEKEYEARADLAFMSDVEAARRQAPGIFANFLLMAVAIFVVIFLIWASFATLDEVTRGNGRVIPSSEVQVLQNLEGGIVSEILVREGAIVERDEVLLRIDNRLAEADFRDTYTRFLRLAAAVARLQAEVNESSLTFPDKLMAEVPDAVADERASFQARQDQLSSAIRTEQAIISQRRQEISELQSQQRNLEESISLSREEQAIIEPTVEQGISPRIDLLNIRRKINELSTTLEGVTLAIPRARSALREAQSRLEERKRTFKAQAQAELTARRNELASLKEIIQAEEDRVRRTDVRSPVRGTVKDLLVNTIGGVVKPGQDLAEIVPLDDTLLIEARVRPADIAFISPQQNATIKITAYDFSIFGGLDGQVEDISADTIVDEEGNSYYRVRLRTQNTHLGDDETQNPIIPGMTATVDILTGEKTVLQYLLTPIIRARGTALTER